MLNTTLLIWTMFWPDYHSTSALYGRYVTWQLTNENPKFRRRVQEKVIISHIECKLFKKYVDLHLNTKSSPEERHIESSKIRRHETLEIVSYCHCIRIFYFNVFFFCSRTFSRPYRIEVIHEYTLVCNRIQNHRLKNVI